MKDYNGFTALALATEMRQSNIIEMIKKFKVSSRASTCTFTQGVDILIQVKVFVSDVCSSDKRVSADAHRLNHAS